MMEPSRGMFGPLFGRVIVLTGPTASGKTQLALEVAAQLQRRAGDDSPVAEIISLDSIAVYRGMDIGTAKPSDEQRKAVTHHLIDVVEPHESFSVAQYLQRAHDKVAEIQHAGRLPIFVGGTPMYLKAILRGFDPGPPADECFRRSVEADVAKYGIESLRQRLWQVDPLSTMRIDPNDIRRTIRALEFSHLTGQPISHHQTQFEHARPADEGLVFGLSVPRQTLHTRIEQRVTKMFDDGLIDEVRRLMDNPNPIAFTAAQAVGYREIIDAISTGRDPWDMMEQVQINTRQLARRQETWFRSFSEIRPLATHMDNASVPTGHLARNILHAIDDFQSHAATHA